MKTPESLDVLRAEIRQHTYADEAETVIRLSERAETRLLPERRAAVLEQTRSLVSRCREHASEAGTLDAFLQEFGLSNPEGVALMCLAEALLRVPDSETADRLIAEKIRAGDWQSHLGQSDSLFVNGSVWGLMLTGSLIAPDEQATEDPGAWMMRLVSRLGEPLVRTAVVQAMRILGRQYVLGRTIEEAIERSRGQADRGNLYSFDMLGEGARTWADADRYFDAYRHAIETIGAHSRFDEPTLNDGISIKLSALHPRYEEAQRNSVLARLPSRIQQLARLARQYRLGLSIDAEESTRLDLSLTIFEQLAADPALDQWQGLGFVLQAYQKRAPEVADWLIAVARQTGRQLMVRLVKGAYWDAEIKQSQERGLVGYPVFTRKANTDLCYEVCAGRLLEAPEAIYPQFATHNAITATAVLELGRGRSFELQRLHGMGELLYEELGREQGGMPAPLRVYAPVGSHQDLLPYLVRRLLENGANSSFVNRFLDMELAVDELVLDPLTEVRSHAEHRHPRIPLPRDIFRPAGEPRDSAAGVDLDDPAAWQDLSTAMKAATVHHYQASPDPDSQGAESEITNPARVGEAVGRVTCATAEDLDRALNAAQDAQPDWNAIPAERAAALDATADLLESHCPELMYLICAEAGRTVPDALAEVREAVDFCRYYALQCRAAYAAPRALPGPTGELNELSLHGRGTFACISPWNFPLAIFMGQTAAALAAGNCVMAKPAEQTPLVAARAVELLHRAGVPEAVLQLLPGSGADVGAALASDSRVNGVVFTGSTATARAINQRLAARAGPIVPFIAETGGQNVLIADTTALPEQLVDAVVDSAFRSAGQRCSALRVVYLPTEIADRILTMLGGAMETLMIGDPQKLSTDVGPIIDQAAREGLQAHVAHLETAARLIYRCPLPAEGDQGWFFAPQAWEIRSITQLSAEVFGPILHVIRYRHRELDRHLQEINGTGYGLTLGVHSRISRFAREIFERTRVGNTYVNRNMIGAVVGVQPFGGQGLSGTGPKAGGPNYLTRFGVERTFTDNMTARGGNPELFELTGR